MSSDENINGDNQKTRTTEIELNSLISDIETLLNTSSTDNSNGSIEIKPLESSKEKN